MGVKTEVDRADPPRHQCVLARLHHAHRDIGLAAQQILDAAGEREFDFHGGIGATKSGEQRRQHFGADHFARGDADGSGNFAGRAGGGAPRRAGRRRHRLHMRGDIARDVGGNEAPLRADEQGGAEAVFEFGDLPAKGGLGEPERARRPRQRALAEHAKKRAVMIPIRLSHTNMYR